MKKLLLISAASLVLTTGAFAGNNGIYLGVGIGSSSVNSGVKHVSGSPKIDETDVSKSIKLGFNINKYAAVELSHQNFGEAKFSGNIGDVTRSEVYGGNFAFPTNGYKETLSAKATGLSLLGIYPINDYFNPFIKLGFHRYETINKTSTGYKGRDSGTGFHKGIGFKTILSEKISSMVVYEKYNLGDYDTKNLSLSISYNF